MSALLVIDLINDIVHPQGKIARSASRVAQNQVIAHTNQAITHARTQGWLLIFVKVGFRKEYIDCPKDSPLFGAALTHGALLLDTWGTAWHEQLAVKEDDLIIIKPRVSCFYATPLEALLRAQNIKTLALTGVATDMAIEHTARDAHDRDYQVIIVKNCCETARAEAHAASLTTMSRFANVLEAVP